MPGINRCQYKLSPEAINSHSFRTKSIKMPWALNESPIIRHAGKLGNEAILVSLAALMHEVSFFGESLVYSVLACLKAGDLFFCQKKLTGRRMGGA